MYHSESLQHQPQPAQVSSPPRTILQSPVIDESNDDIDDCQHWKQGSSPPPTPPKGLINPSGTACYINASLLLLCYTCTPIITQYLTQVITNFCSSSSTTERSDHLDDQQLSPHQQPLLNQDTTENQSLDQYECELILLLCSILRSNSTSDDDIEESHRHFTSMVVDPTRFYQSLLYDEISYHPNPVQNINLFQIRYTICGDAVSTLIQLIRFLQDTLSRRDKKELDIGGGFISKPSDDAMMKQPLPVLPLQKSSLTPEFNLVHRLIHSGQVYSVLTGTTTTSSNYISSDSVIAGRIPTAVASKVSSPGQTKTSKVRPLMNPMPMTIHPQQQHPNASCHRNETFSTLHDVLHNTFCTEQHVAGYTWNDVVRAEDDSATSKVTTRRWHVLSFPPIFMIHLQRFTIKNTDCNDTPIVVKPIEDCDSHVRIPTELDMSIYVSAEPSNHENDATGGGNDIRVRPSMVDTTASYSLGASTSCTNDDDHYHLVGGILHIHDYDDSDNDEGSMGHYITVVRQRSSTEDQYQWYVMDDELVNPVSIDQVVLWLGGSWYDEVSKCRSDDSNHCGSSQLFARGVLLVYHQHNLKCGTDWDVIPTSMFRDLSLVMSCQLGTCREQKSASRLQPDIPPASTEDNFPGTDARTNATKSYWLDDSDDDD